MNTDFAQTNVRISDLGEDELVRRIAARIRAAGAGEDGAGALGPADVLVGNGDDAAVLRVDGATVVSSDTVVQDLDFRLDWSSAHDVGVKLVAQNLADVAAMGAVPVAFVTSLAAPGDLPLRWALDLTDGIADECARAGVLVAGGDIATAPQIVLTGTALGRLDGPAVRRGGARPGQRVVVGPGLGRSFAGLDLFYAADGDAARLQAHLADPVSLAVMQVHRAPRPDYAAGRTLAGLGAGALIDVSDGLLRDAGRLGHDSGCVLDLHLQALLDAAHPDLVAAAHAHAGALPGGRDAHALLLRWLLTGGEDHTLLACLPQDAAVPPGYRTVGTVLDAAAPGVPHGHHGVLVDGAVPTGATGWTHFAPAPQDPLG